MSQSQLVVISMSASGWALRWSTVPQSSPQWASGCVPPSWEAEEVLSGALKITRCDMVKGRSYGSMWQSTFISLLSVSLTPQKFWLQEEQRELYFYHEVLLSFSLHVYSFFMALWQNDLIVLFHTIQFSKSHLFALSLMSNSSIWPIDRTLIKCYHSGPEWTREQWQWRDTPYFPELHWLKPYH